MASVAACDKTHSIALKPENPVDRGQVKWGHSLLAMKSWQFDLVKIET